MHQCWIGLKLGYFKGDTRQLQLMQMHAAGAAGADVLVIAHGVNMQLLLLAPQPFPKQSGGAPEIKAVQEVAADDQGVGGRGHGVWPACRDEQRLSRPQLVSRAALRAPSKEAASLRQARRMVKSCSRASTKPTTGQRGPITCFVRT